MSRINSTRLRSRRAPLLGPGRAVLLASLLAVSWPVRAPALDGEGPLPRNVKAASAHAPYAAGDCGLCHQLKKGAPLPETGDSLCLSCHEDARKHTHAPRKCTRCHNSHDATRPRLLRADLSKCTECHQKG